MRILTALGGVALALSLAAPAMAADLPVMAETGFDWTGFYLGAQGGYGWGRDKVTGGGATTQKPDDFFVGGRLASLYQTGQLVIGAEGELNYSWLDGRKEIPSLRIGGTSVSTDLKWFGSLNAKAGYAIDRILIFATGGLSFARVETGQDVPIFFDSFSKTKTHFGWTLGGGVDYAVTDNIVAGVQYRYYDFGSKDVRAARFVDRKSDYSLQTVAGSLSYKF